MPVLRLYVCDHCGARAEAQSMPAGWFTLPERQPSLYCPRHRLVQWFEYVIDAEHDTYSAPHRTAMRVLTDGEPVPEPMVAKPCAPTFQPTFQVLV